MINEKDKIRLAYESEVEALKLHYLRLVEADVSTYHIAYDLFMRRRRIGRKYKMLRPEEYRNKLFERNLKKYDSKWGPTFNYLLKTKNYQEIILSAFKVNKDYVSLINSLACENLYKSNDIDTKIKRKV